VASAVVATSCTLTTVVFFMSGMTDLASDWAKLVGCMNDFVNSEFSWVVRDRTMLVNYVLILANTGIRVGEARGLKWSDLKELPAPNGSNQPPILVLYVKGKTGAREVVAATPEVKQYFKTIFELRRVELEKQGKDFSLTDYVFCNRDGTSVGSFKKSFGALLKLAGVETDRNGNKRTIYSLRHTYATNLLEGGVHQFILAKNMGTSTAMLERHYGHTSNVASAAELTKGGRVSGDGQVKVLEWIHR
jgi:integrase